MAFLALPCLAGNPSPIDLGRLPLRVFGMANAPFPMDYTGAVAFDRAGHLWTATQEGLLRYDGRTWLRVPLPRPARSNWALCLLPASDGSLWCGTYGDGLHRYHEGRWSSFTPEQGFPDSRVNSLAEAPGADGRPVIWAGTHDHGIVAVRPDGSRAEHLDLGRVHALAALPDGLWAGTERGLLRRTSRGWENLRGGTAVYALAPAPGGVWAGTGQGLGRWEAGRWTLSRAGLAHPAVKSLAVFPDGALWAGTSAGLARWDGDRFRLFGPASGLPSPVIEALAAYAPPGSPPQLWAATSGGLAQLQLGRWTSFRRSPGGLPESNVFAIHQARDGSFWFGTYGGGLARLTGDRWSALRSAAGRPLTAVRSLQETFDGQGQSSLWVGTFRQGLFRLRRGAWELVPLPKRLERAEWRQITELGGQLWAATSEGLARFQAGQWEVWTAAQGLPHDDVLKVVATPGPRGPVIWAATLGGVACLDQGRWSRIGPAEGLPAPRVVDLLPRKDGSLWLATAGGGVWALDPHRTPFRPEGTPGDGTVYGFQEDRQGRVHCFTQDGVVRLEPGGRQTRFTTGDGLPHDDCNHGASLVDRQGRLWVGTPGGVGVLDPATALPDTRAKSLHLAANQGPGREEARPGLSLPSPRNHIRFELSLLDFVRESDVRYRTQLVGLEKEPTPWLTDPLAEYPRLPPGRYEFRAWAKDHAGNETGPVVFPLTVRRPPWLAPWALLGYGAALALAVTALLRIRTRYLARRNRELEARIQEATKELEALNQEKNELIALVAHDLKGPLSLIQQLSEGLIQGEIAGPSHPWLEMVSRAAGDMSGLIHRVLNVSALDGGGLIPSMEPVDVAEIAAREVQALLPKAERKGLVLDIEGLPDELWARTDGPFVREILYNLLSNAVKFSPPGSTVWVRGRAQGNLAVLEVQDQGPGLTEEDKASLFHRFAQLSARPTGEESSTGLGLSIAKRLVELLQGWIHVESEAGKGATFRVELPAP